jgi:D-inositol-3-phosphate glycosyltransferase
MGDQAPNTRPRVAVVSLHTSPLDQPGTGDSGGMNVYIRAAADRLAARGLDVDVFTRCRGEDLREVEDLDGGARLVRVKAGPCAPVPKEDLPRYLPEFLGGMLRRERIEGRPYDLVHSHYWLSGWVGRGAKELWGVPLVASFHTLGKVKNYSLARDEPSEPSVRLAGEHAVIAEADRIMAATPAEASQLVGLYAADPGSRRPAWTTVCSVPARASDRRSGCI